MYKEVAFDPQCLSEYYYYGLLKSSFGFEKGRYVIAPVREWAREAFLAVKNAQNIQPVKKKSIINFLNKLQKEKQKNIILLPKHRENIGGANWLEWLLKQDAHLPFDSIISERIDNAIDYDKVIDGDENWHIPSTTRIKKTSTDISMMISPLLRFGGHLYIIDQYFSLASNPVLVGIFQLIQSFQSITRITLVTSVKTLNPHATFESEYADLFDYLPKFEIVQTKERIFHDRYIISENGAIKAGHGLSESKTKGTQADKLSISLCGQEESQETIGWIETVLTDGRASRIVLNAKSVSK